MSMGGSDKHEAREQEVDRRDQDARELHGTWCVEDVDGRQDAG